MIRNPFHTQVAPPRNRKRITYSEVILGDIAEAIGKDVVDLLPHQKQFEAAATWYELDTALPTRIAPSKVKRKLESTAKAAHKLLEHLNIDDPADAPDGLGDITILDALASVDGEGKDSVTQATTRIGRLVEILEAIEAVREMERLAEQAITDVTRLGELTVPQGHQGDAAVNNWAASMFEIYCSITGSEPKTSVGGWGRPDEGIAGGPLIRFLQAACAPLQIHYDCPLPDVFEQMAC